MKKYLIAAAIAVIFLVYSLHLRSQHSKVVIGPSNSSTSTAKSSSGSNTSGSSTSATNQSTTPVSYKDGTYTGSVANAYYGNVQVAVDISGSKITNVNFLQTPNENPNSIYINGQAKPYLAQEAIRAQSANVNIVTGATLTSEAFVQSLSDALSQAKN